MAYWTRRDGKIHVFVWKEGKQKRLSRELVKHLDGDQDHNVQYWVDQYERTHEADRLKSPRPSHPKLDELKDAFLSHLKDYKKRSPDTVREHRQLLGQHIIPYFLSFDPPLIDPNQWPSVSVRMADYLTKNKVTKQVHRKCVNSLRVFWAWLEEEGIIKVPTDIRTRRPLLGREETPLKHLLTPADVLKFAADCKDPQIKLMALQGYFFSLRTNEQFAINPKQFDLSKTIEPSLDCCKVMKKAGLYSKFAYHVTHQAQADGEWKDAKAGSKGWVACFNRDAAIQIADLVNAGVELRMNPNIGMKMWKKDGIKEVTLKDLRRASIYWLGHNSTLTPINLMAHARHAHMTTTQLYLRRPVEESEGSAQLDVSSM